MVDGARSKVDYVLKLDGKEVVLCEMKSPSVMKAFFHLPNDGIHFHWTRNGTLLEKVFMKVYTHSGLYGVELKAI